ncbi:MAG: hypothetical protein KJ630_20020 [Proteobacteria bacterium]|nr:hypothetical protein [Pseudomonadota bacterium]
MFITTRDNRSAQIMLDKGEIVYLFFSSKRGQEALELMSTIRDARYRFQEGGAVSRRMQLPTTWTILQALNNELGQVAAPAREPAEAKALVGKGLSAEQKSVLETCLVDCIGPMAAIICEDHFNYVGDLQAAIEALSGEIPSPAQVKKFREMVTERLG